MASSATKQGNFDPDAWSEDTELQARVAAALADDDLHTALTLAFALPAYDRYVYRAVAEVTLAQAQRAVSLGRANGLHRWYLKEEKVDTNINEDAGNSPTPTSTGKTTGAIVPPTEANDAGNPPLADIDAYVGVFSATAHAGRALTGLGANAKKGSLRASVASYLSSKRYLDTEALGVGETGPAPRKKKKGNNKNVVAAHWNPALDFWAWSCRALEWAGPCEAATRAHMAHPVLPLFMHHFGCVAPSWEALEVVRLVVEARRREVRERRQRKKERKEEKKVVAKGGGGGGGGEEQGNGTGKKGRGGGIKGGDDEDNNDNKDIAVLDIGSGNGYWSYALRRHGVATRAVDSGQSAFRSTWIADTERADGARWLRQKQQRQTGSGSSGRVKGKREEEEEEEEDDDVLLLVYPVVGADFTRAMLREYRGRDVIVAGTQNTNGYTGFADMTMDEFAAREMSGWRKTVQIPLPSFAGKDEALFVFRLDDS